ncbi:MAG: zinc-ribbon domain-containing protein [Lachnospiraceae bacterium]|nr:zinc-ribbon domain-containing protein [Lachnospiraceae bacterium]
MKCKQCGVELEEGAVFCQSCGAKVEAPAEEAPKAEEKPAEEAPKAEEKPAEEAPKAEEKPAEEAPKAEEKPAEEAPKAEEKPADEAPKAEEAPQAQPQAAQPQADAAGKKSKVLPIILIAAAAVVVLILAIVGIKALFSGKKGDTSTVVAYVSRDTLCVIMDATAKDPKILEVCDIDIDDDLYDLYYGANYVPDSLVRWSDDEKTLYFFNDVDSDGSATLCKVTVSKLGKDKSKNESKIVEIDDKVKLDSLRFLEDGRIAYLTTKDKLMVYNGKESVEVEKDVYSIRTVNGGKGFLLLADATDEGNYTLLYADSKFETTEIDDDVSYIKFVTDDKVYYAKVDSETWEYSLYVSGFDGKSEEEICDDFDYMGTMTDGGFYYTERIDSEENLYDYIIDPYEKDDNDAVEPVSPDTSAGFVLSSENEAFDEYKQGRIKKNYDDALDYMESNCSIYTYGGVDYYYIWNSDNWNDYYYDINADKYYRYDSDTYYAARDTYYEELDEWYAIQSRISLRESLKEYTFDPGYVSLNYYHDGKSEELVSECAQVELVYLVDKAPMAVYSLPSEDSVEKIHIDDIGYAYEAYDQIFGYEANNQSGELLVAVGSDTDISLDVEGQINDTIISEDDGLFAIVVYVRDKNDESEKQIMLYDMKGTSFTLNEKFDDEAEALCAFKNGVVYFMKGTNSEGSEADLYVYDGKDNTKVIKNVSLYYDGIVYDNGSILCFDDSDAVIYDKNGEQIVKLGYIASIYSDINRISDKKIVFYSDGKLRYYNGKETIKIVSSVDNVWFNSSVGGTYLNIY